MRPLLLALLIIAPLAAMLPGNACAETGKECAAHWKDVPIKDVIAGAGVWENFRSNPGSINFESNAIFNQAKERSEKLDSPGDFCPNGCTAAKWAVLIFSSAPRKVRSNYGDAAMCASLFESSTKRPFMYRTPSVRTVDELNDWIGDLSQGRGADGRDLYERCPGDCSPRFDYFISKNAGAPESYSVRASIVCGAARDKDDNSYELKSLFRWYCE